MSDVLNTSRGDGATRVVSAFYDRFPYPGDPLQDGPPPGYNWRWSYSNVVSACTGAIPIPQTNPIRILDAGCGTGVSTDYLCYLNPGADILAIDISDQALDIARNRIRRSNAAAQVSRLRQEQCSILNLSEKNSFHYINSVGVLHHLRDPKIGLQALADCLVPGGLIHLFLYADGGRWEIHRTQRALKLMGIGSNDEGLILGRKLLKELPSENRLRKHHEERWALDTAADANFADMYFHPQETSYNITNLFELINSADLNFIGFSNPTVWDLSRLMKGELLKRALALPIEKQWLLIEALDPDISHFELFASKGQISQYQWSENSTIVSTQLTLNPCLWGLPSYSILGPDFEALELDDKEMQLIRSLQDEPENDAFISSSTIASTIRTLYSKRVIMLAPATIKDSRV